jgi:hypothetical protein
VSVKGKVIARPLDDGVCTYLHVCEAGSPVAMVMRPAQALMYPLLVACKSQSTSRRAAAMAVVDNVRLHSATLVQQAQLVSFASCFLLPKRAPGSCCGILVPTALTVLRCSLRLPA